MHFCICIGYIQKYVLEILIGITEIDDANG